MGSAQCQTGSSRSGLCERCARILSSSKRVHLLHQDRRRYFNPTTIPPKRSSPHRPQQVILQLLRCTSTSNRSHLPTHPSNHLHHPTALPPCLPRLRRPEPRLASPSPAPALPPHPSHLRPNPPPPTTCFPTTSAATAFSRQFTPNPPQHPQPATDASRGLRSGAGVSCRRG